MRHVNFLPYLSVCKFSKSRKCCRIESKTKGSNLSGFAVVSYYVSHYVPVLKVNLGVYGPLTGEWGRAMTSRIRFFFEPGQCHSWFVVPKLVLWWILLFTPDWLSVPTFLKEPWAYLFPSGLRSSSWGQGLAGPTHPGDDQSSVRRRVPHRWRHRELPALRLQGRQAPRRHQRPQHHPRSLQFFLKTTFPVRVLSSIL